MPIEQCQAEPPKIDGGNSLHEEFSQKSELAKDKAVKRIIIKKKTKEI